MTTMSNIMGLKILMNEENLLQQNDKDLIYRLKSFSDIVIRLASEHNIDKLLILILKELRDFTRADAGSLYIREGNMITFKVTQNDTLEATPRSKFEYQKKFKSFSLPINEKSLAGLSAYRKETFNIPDVPKSPYHSPDMDKKFGYPIISMLVVPMLNHSGDLVGILQLMNSKHDKEFVPFDTSLIPQVEGLANQAAVVLDNLRLYNELDNLFDSLVKYSAKAIDARDPATAGHSERVAQYAVEVGKEFNCFNSDELMELRYAAFFHDIGKIGVRENVLTKENKLSKDQVETIKERFNLIKQFLMTEKVKHNWDDEKLNEKISDVDKDLEDILEFNKPGFMSDEKMEKLNNIYRKTFINIDGKPRKYLRPHEYDNLRIKKGNLNVNERINIESHPVHSFRILSQIPFPENLKRIPEIASKHHEKLDGSGYPNGCTAEDIPLQAKILAVVDVYDALVAQDRPYKKPMSKEKALSILDAEVEANHFCPDVVKTLKEVLEKKDTLRLKRKEKRQENNEK
ncbi:MAG: GAF and HD-GYP domain-containing protein [Vampirovibrionia bacterium]